MATPVNQSDVQAQAAVAYKSGVDQLVLASGTGNGAPAPATPTGSTPNQCNLQAQNATSDVQALSFAG